jgi:hypothetical protein
MPTAMFPHKSLYGLDSVFVENSLLVVTELIFRQHYLFISCVLDMFIDNTNPLFSIGLKKVHVDETELRMIRKLRPSVRCTVKNVLFVFCV